MTTRTAIASTALAGALISALVACGTGESEAESPDTDAMATDAPAVTEPAADTTPEPTPTPDPQPVTESTTAPPTIEPTTVPPTTEPAATASSTIEPAAREPSPPLVGTTELLVDGVSPLPDRNFLGPPGPGRYHSYRLGTEIVFDVPEQFNLGQHRAGSIAWDLDLDRILFISRWGENEALGPDAWIDELLASEWEVAEIDWPDISGNGVRRFDVTPTTRRETIGGVNPDGALWFGDGLPKRIWLIDQSDGQPVVIGTSISTESWADFAEGVVASMELGATRPDPRNGREPIEYSGDFWSAEAGARYRTLLFDDAVVSFPDDTSGLASAQYLSFGVLGEFTGTSEPTVEIGAVGELVLPPPEDPAPDNSDRAGGPPADATDMRDHITLLADQGFISAPRTLDTAATLLGQPTTLLEFDVPNGAEVYPAVSEPDGWSATKLYTLQPGRTYRVWTVDIDDQVAIVLASADTGNIADLDQATADAETVMGAFRIE